MEGGYCGLCEAIWGCPGFGLVVMDSGESNGKAKIEHEMVSRFS